MKPKTKQEAKNGRRIVVEKDGPYIVHGNVPLVHKVQVVSEYGEPLTWQKVETIETRETYRLCRCGRSGRKPFCDNTHAREHLVGTESAEVGVTAERQVSREGGTKIVVKRDMYLCTDAGFCANRVTSVDRMVSDTHDTQVRAQVMAMIERCPSGSYTYCLEEGGIDVEPDLPAQIAATTEIVQAGPVAGPLWVTGHIPVERADGQPFETRNRVTLCRCGRSGKKPLCDGKHRRMGATESTPAGDDHG